MVDQPWASGPAEILSHGISHLANDSDHDRRIAMISIDNAVELMLKTFLGLPRRITGLTITRKELQEAETSFPALLDLAESQLSDRLAGIDLGQVEWFHRLRNELYHQGNGLTVEREKVQVYAEMGRQVLRVLFGVEAVPLTTSSGSALEAFMDLWVRFEQALRPLANKSVMPGRAHRLLLDRAIITGDEYAFLDSFRRKRNEVVHGMVAAADAFTSAELERFRQLVERAEHAIDGQPKNDA